MRTFTGVGTVVVVVLAVELMADSAVNSFAALTGDGVRTSGDAGFVVVNAPDSMPLTLTARPGWRFNEGATKTVTYRRPQVLAIPIFGRDGEERETLIVSNVSEHVHQATNYSEHVACGALKAVTEGHLLGLYPESADGASLFASGSYEVLRDHVHEEVREQLPCPVDQCPWGKGEDRITTTNVYFRPLPVEVSQTFGGQRQASGLYPKGSYAYSYAVTHSNKCEQCCCSAADDGVADVYRAEMETEPWIGLDRTDEGRLTSLVKTAVAAVPDFDGAIACRWTPSGHCVEMSGGKTKSFSYRPKDHDTPSTCYRGELHACEVAISDAHGCSDEVQVTNRFTIVKLDVQIGEDDHEMTEESEGYSLYEVPDEGGEWTEEGTNALVQVKITCDPHDSKMLSERVAVEVRDELLYECRTVNGRKEYVRAKSSYTVRELQKAEFFLHGHSRSDKYLGDAIKVTHPTSGAVDLAKFTVFGRPWLVPDYDRKHGIDDDDLAKAKQGKTMYFWANRDIWKGDDFDKGRKFNNASDKKVNGRHDLVNFLPLGVDFSEIADMLDLSCHVVSLGSDDGAVGKARLMMVILPWKSAELVASGHSEKTLNNSCAYEARLDKIGSRYILKEAALTALKKRTAILAIEFPEEARDKYLEIKIENFAKKVVTKGALKLHVGNVDSMYGWCNIRSACDDSSGEKTNYATPDWPASEHRAGNVMFVHGYNMTAEEARTWSRSVFKRLWWAGLNVGFIGVDWRGDAGRLPIKGGITPNYYRNVVGALSSAKALANEMSAVPEGKWFIAHSLGNMLVSAARHDYGMEYRKFFLVNAAVAKEAYVQNPTIDEAEKNGMTPSVWLPYHDFLRSTHWHELFDPSSDGRSHLTWKGRFSRVINKFNFYSSQEEVLKKGDGDWHLYPRRVYAWYNQETRKGENPLTMHSCEAGWAFSSHYDRTVAVGVMDLSIGLRRETMLVHLRPAEANALNPERLKSKPFFAEFDNSQLMTPDGGSLIREGNALHSELLAYAIPSETFASGVDEIFAMKNVDMAYKYEEAGKYLKSGDRPWVHTTLVQRPYCRTYALYHAIVDEL